jgi:hypothetical protein
MELQGGYVKGYSRPYSGICDGLLVPQEKSYRDIFPTLTDVQPISVSVRQDISPTAIAHIVLKSLQTN